MFDSAYPVKSPHKQEQPFQKMKERHTPHLVHARPKILILALGNPLHGDDGIGAAIIQTLDHIPTFPSNVTLMDGGTGGIKIAQWIQDYQFVFIIDAADFEHVPGEWRRFSIDDILRLSERKGPGLTLHNAGLTYALELASVLSTLPSRIVIYAIQTQNVDWSLGISEPVQRVIPEICESIVKEIQDLDQVNDGTRPRKRRNEEDGQDFSYR